MARGCCSFGMSTGEAGEDGEGEGGGEDEGEGKGEGRGDGQCADCAYPGVAGNDATGLAHPNSR